MLTACLWSLMLMKSVWCQPVSDVVFNKSFSTGDTLSPLDFTDPSVHFYSDPAKIYMADSLVQDAGKFVINIYQLVHQPSTNAKKNKKTKFPLSFPQHKVFVDPFGNRISLSLGLSINFQAALN